MKNLLFIGSVVAALAATGWAREGFEAPEPKQTYEDLFTNANHSDPKGFSSNVQHATLACNAWEKDSSFRSEISRKTTLEIAPAAITKVFELRIEKSNGKNVERDDFLSWITANFGDRLMALDGKDFDQVILRVGEALSNTPCVMRRAVESYYST